LQLANIPEHSIKTFREPLIKSKISIFRHSGARQNPVKTIVYWMLVFTSTTMKAHNQSFPK